MQTTMNMTEYNISYYISLLIIYIVLTLTKVSATVITNKH